MLSTEPDRPRRGEIWIVNLDPTQGAEIRKSRPAVIISSDGVGRLPIKLIAPITDWKPGYANSFWHIHLVPDSNNGLSKESAVDALQLRGVDTGRLTKRIGVLPAAAMQEIAAAVAAIIEYQ